MGLASESSIWLNSTNKAEVEQLAGIKVNKHEILELTQYFRHVMHNLGWHIASLLPSDGVWAEHHSALSQYKGGGTLRSLIQRSVIQIKKSSKILGVGAK
jgi:hypothetical protein